MRCFFDVFSTFFAQHHIISIHVPFSYCILFFFALDSKIILYAIIYYTGETTAISIGIPLYTYLLYHGLASSTRV